MFFCVIIKNLNWENLTKNSVTFKKWDRVKDQKFYLFIFLGMGGGGGVSSLKHPDYSGVDHEIE